MAFGVYYYRIGDSHQILRRFPTEGEAVAFILGEMDDLAEANDRYGLGDVSSEIIAEVISEQYTIEQV